MICDSKVGCVSTWSLYRPKQSGWYTHFIETKNINHTSHSLKRIFTISILDSLNSDYQYLSPSYRSITGLTFSSIFHIKYFFQIKILQIGHLIIIISWSLFTNWFKLLMVLVLLQISIHLVSIGGFTNFLIPFNWRFILFALRLWPFVWSHKK